MKVNKQFIVSLTGLIVGLVLVYFFAWQLIPKSLVTFTRASTVGKVDLSKSLLIGSKILAVADGEDKCVVNVFVVDRSGKGISGKTVSLNGINTVSPASSVSDNLGKATFTMTSIEARQFELEASVNGAFLNNKLTVTFRKK
ncbi:MAG: Ig-like domain-containing protein [Candidatus Shapirobacteria bacterium]|nr:Ig-like domain-containing protein [Candidatus Shapirobacteria bacterium]